MDNITGAEGATADGGAFQQDRVTKALVDGLRGDDGHRGDVLGKAHITVNKNAVPNDPQSPFVTSGIRIGSPAITTRGFKERECRELTRWMCDILDDLDNAAANNRVRGQVAELCARFPVYG